MDPGTRVCVATVALAALAPVARADGFELEGSYAAEVFTAPTFAGRPVALSGLAALALDLDLAIVANEHLGTLHAAAFGIHGRGISERLMDAFGVSGNTATPEVRLYETWYEQPVGPLAIRAGLLTAEEFTVADHSGGLLAATFGILGSLSYAIGNPVFPVATPGASSRVVLDEVTVRAGVFDGAQRNRYGIPTSPGNDLLALGELGLGETFKIGGWHHTELGSALYLVLDRQLDDSLSTFLRMSVSPEDALPFYFDAGVQLRGASVGLAFAQADIGPQTVVEASYELVVTGRLTLQPDLQILLMRDATIAVFGARATVSL